MADAEETISKDAWIAMRSILAGESVEDFAGQLVPVPPSPTSRIKPDSKPDQKDAGGKTQSP